MQDCEFYRVWNWNILFCRWCKTYIDKKFYWSIQFELFFWVASAYHRKCNNNRNAIHIGYGYS